VVYNFDLPGYSALAHLFNHRMFATDFDCFIWTDLQCPWDVKSF